jgi:hypothetical protein
VNSETLTDGKISLSRVTFRSPIQLFDRGWRDAIDPEKDEVDLWLHVACGVVEIIDCRCPDVVFIGPTLWREAKPQFRVVDATPEDDSDAEKKQD